MAASGAVSTIAALGTSPLVAWGTPYTPQSATAGWPCNVASISAGATENPETLIISLARSVMWIHPSGSTHPTSPVRSQPSRNASASASAGR